MPFSEPKPALPSDALTETYLCDETTCVRMLVEGVQLSPKAQSTIQTQAATLTRGLLEDAKHLSAVDAFLNAYTLSSEEGVLLMRLAESLVRTPDTPTARLLLRDKIAAGTWLPHLSARHALVKFGTCGLAAAKAWIKLSGGTKASNIFAQLGDRIMLTAVRQAIALLGRHFVLGTSIAAATKRAASLSDYGAAYSYDMLGEAAMTDADAARYFDAYKTALDHLAATSPPSESLHRSPALSVKLSALHPRYEYAQRDRCVPILTERLLALSLQAKAANIGLTVDAEEVDRLEVSLSVIEGVLDSERLRDWDGFGLAIQTYQKRAPAVIDWVRETAARHRQKLTVRLVKGAYWDSEIKRAQELGLADYPVFTRKAHTDISYLACARKLLDAQEWIYPQFATHNAHTAAAILHMAGSRRDLEFQRLHGMSDGLHRRLAIKHGFATRTYAPVGRHKELLPYLVRRLLENGANSSFVNQLLDSDGNVDDLIKDPIKESAQHGFSPHPAIKPPCERPGDTRRVAPGIDLTQSNIAASVSEITAPDLTRPMPPAPNLQQRLASCSKSPWPSTTAAHRASVLRRAADLLERDRETFLSLCVYEAHKTWPDAEAEWREAVDFLRYYADQAERPDMEARSALGPVTCISPWNFPLAIFLGQVSAALSVGNTVLAKPAEQTPRIALRAVEILYEAGVPRDALHLFIGDGSVGAALVSAPEIKGVCFTGSTQTAKKIAASLADTGRADVPLIAETGGINTMVIDSTALLEQAVQDVIVSAFQSAGQRCSACRLVCVQEDITDSFIDMLSGAMRTLRTDEPSKLSTDLGPLIDDAARSKIAEHVTEMKRRHKIIGEAPAPDRTDAPYLSPIAFELNAISDLSEEIFGPVLHVVRFKANEVERVVEQVNALGFGLTMGLHTRIDARIAAVTAQARVGNLYVNRNQIGAVVGEQPFGGEGLSGTGPKAGGPNYLKRLSTSTMSSHDLTPTTAIDLPGPTGETNTLHYAPRGRILCLGGDQASDLDAQLRRVRETGNIPALLSDDELNAALEDQALRGVIADGKIRETVAHALAHRDGAILPLLSLKDSAARFMVERAVTIDTTAAGGNASLLASS